MSKEIAKPYTSRPPDSVAKYLNGGPSIRNEKDLQEMSENHEKLINLILTEEEELISAHRNHIDHMVGIVKEEMAILHEVDQPGSDVDDYITALNRMLEEKLKMVQMIQRKLENFTGHLRTEEEMSKKFYQLQTEILENKNN